MSKYSAGNNPLYPGLTTAQDPGFPGNPPRTFNLARWENLSQAQWRQEGADYTWTWSSEIFDLRPDYDPDDQREVSAHALDRVAAKGAGAQLRVLIYPVGSGDTPASLGEITVEFWEAGNDQPSRNNPDDNEPQVFVLTQAQDITDEVLSGGLDTTLNGQSYRGASALTFTPPGDIRLWQVFLRITLEGGAAPLAIQATAY